VAFLHFQLKQDKVERDLACGSSGQDLIIGEELLGSDRHKGDLDFLPQGVEAIAGDRIEDADESRVLI
jgi:hypothetical protein